MARPLHLLTPHLGELPAWATAAESRAGSRHGRRATFVVCVHAACPGSHKPTLAHAANSPQHAKLILRPCTLCRTQVCAYSPTHGGRAESLYDRLLAEGMEVDTFMYLHLVTALGSGGWDQAVGRSPQLDLSCMLPARWSRRMLTCVIAPAHRPQWHAHPHSP